MKGGVNYKGKGWPGASYYIDFIDEDARAVWAEQYDLKNYKNS
jgi:alpha-glucosidase (family GH31 glycosyl hydrolase)